MRDLFDLGGFAFTDKSARVGGLEFLCNGVGNLGACGLGESVELGE